MRHTLNNNGLKKNGPSQILPASLMPPLRMPFRFILLGLFLWPKFSLLTVRLQGGWFAPLALILACALFGSIVKSAFTSPDYVEDVRLLVTTIGSQLGTMHVRNDTLQWSSQDEFPKTVQENDWRLDVLGSGDSLDIGTIEQGIDGKGIVISPNGLRFWFRSPDTGKLFPMNFDFPVPYVISFMNAYGTPRDNIPSITPAELKQCPQRLYPLIFFCLTCFHFSLYLQPIFLCSFIFIILTLVFRRERGLPFGNLLASALCSCTPPFLLAMIYDLIPLWQLEYHTLFVAVFFIYLIIILIDKSVIIPKDKDTPSNDDTDF